MTRADAARLAEVEAIVGGRIVEITNTAAPWETGTLTQIAVLDGGDRVVVQWMRDRRALARRLRIGRGLSAVAPRVPNPEVLGGNVRAPEPFLVTRFVPGQSGRDLVGNRRGATLVGRQMGALVADLRRVPTRGLRLSTRWGDPERLTAAGRRWLAEAAPALGPHTTRLVGHLLDRAPGDLDGARPVFTHGDLAPVNVIFRGGALVAVLDFERSRLAHPLFDAAWWRWIVRYHHPESWAIAGPAFFAAAGLALDPATRTRLDLLAALQVLEMLEGTPRLPVGTRAEWIARLRHVVKSRHVV
jgi:aminoglycoside phosphotransferase (APT) family kinase protein